MFVPYLKEGIEAFLDEMYDLSDEWGYRICERALKACDGDDYFLKNIMDTYMITGSFGMHPQEKIIKHRIPVEPLHKSSVFSCIMRGKDIKGKETEKISAVVADKLCENLYAITSWLCGVDNLKDMPEGEWAACPAVAFLSIPEPLSECSNNKREYVKKLFPEIYKHVFNKRVLYGTLPFETLKGNALENARDMDYVDSGADFIIRFLLIKQIPDFHIEKKRKGSHVYKRIRTPDNKLLGDIDFVFDPETMGTHDDSIAIDVLPNILNFGDDVSKSPEKY